LLNLLFFLNTSTEFIPPTATWISCTSFTYQPHSNECGLHAILAILRWWIAFVIVNKCFQIEPIAQLFLSSNIHHDTSHYKESYPADLANLSIRNNDIDTSPQYNHIIY
jgi:hypothetical protein